ncbi:MAG TPA: hypothetical protein VLL76_03700 [Candidatus Omnitrophota bacterium]|nr:hypothetical protein [Candidatus Omnitrophota bacterium]
MLLWPGVALAQCPAPGMAKTAPVTFKTELAEPVYRNDRKRDELTTSSADALGTPEVQKSGLTRVQFRFEVVPSFQWVALPDGRTCMALKEVQATWRMTDLVVDVAAEYRPGTCQYREVRAHEDQHVRFNRDTFLEHAPRMEARLKTVAHDMRPTITDLDPERTMQAMAERLSHAAGEVQASFEAAIAARHATIDTAESYKAVSRRCDKW